MMDEYPKRSNQRMSLIGYKIRQRALSKKSIKDKSDLLKRLSKLSMRDDQLESILKPKQEIYEFIFIGRIISSLNSYI